MMKHVGKNIKSLRLKQGWSQNDIAVQLNISIPAFSKIETGATDINLSRLSQLSEVFCVDVIEILMAPGESIFKAYINNIQDLEEELFRKDKEINALQKKIIDLFDELRLHNKNT